MLVKFLGLTFYVCDALGSTLAVEKASVTDVLPHRTAVVSAAHTLMKILTVSVSKTLLSEAMTLLFLVILNDSSMS